MNNLSKIFLKRGAKIFGVFLLVIILLIVFRFTILKSIGNHLIQEDPEAFALTTFVLGGNSFDRGMKALDVYNKKLTDKIVCTGGNIPSVLTAIDTSLFESEITTSLLIKNGIPSKNIVSLSESTSTLEESDEILKYCLDNNIKKANLITSKFHLRRVRNVFEERFLEEGIQLNFIGAPSSSYDEKLWWKSEEGMIMVNNEWMKLFYYWVR